MAGQSWAAKELIRNIGRWNSLAQEERLGDLTFMKILTKSQDEVPKPEFVYCFVDLEDDPLSTVVQTKKHYQRLRSFSKILRVQSLFTQQLSTLPGSFTPLLSVLTRSVDLLQVAEATTSNPTPLQARVKALAACGFLKLCVTGQAQLPSKVAPILQALVTAIRVIDT